MKEYTIHKRQEGQRLDKYLAKILNTAPKSFIYRMLRKKNIVLNGHKAAGSEILKAGDMITLWLSDETIAGFRKDDHVYEDYKKLPPVTVVYEDDDILIMNKPAGILSQKAGKDDVSMNERMIGHLLRNGSLKQTDLKDFKPSVVNRLDRETSGLLFAGKTIFGLQYLSRMLKDRSLRKYYHCIVSGQPDGPVHLNGYLTKDNAKNLVTICDDKKEGSSYIETAFKPLKRSRNAALLEVHLITGRPHQIRAHLSAVGYPIWGDPKYGDEKTNRTLLRQYGLKHQLLCAKRVVFPDGRIFEVPYPEIFEKILKEEFH